MEKVFIRRSKRILSGHLWIFSNELMESPRRFEPGDVVDVYDKNGHFLGIGYINPHSLISIRLLTDRREAIDKDFLRRRILDAQRYRERMLGGCYSCRVVFSEGDLLPGLIVDKYSDVIVIQLLTYGMERLKDMIIDVIDEIFNPSNIILRNDTPFRSIEGLLLKKEVIKGSGERVVINEDGVMFEIDALSGQKTGFFLDQRDNRIAFKDLIGEGRGLDLFCYTGAWAVHMAVKGADVIGIDESDYAIETAMRNAEINKLSNRCRFIRSDVFEFMDVEVREGNKYDYIVLDPPAFVKSKDRVREAISAYRRINTSAMKLLKRRGILATSSCSYHVGRETFLDMLRSSAKEAGRRVRLIEMRSQARDHPILLSMPETGYLKCAFLEVI
ncbi:MAG: class I SAM-dependent rRNA methyltransferase [Thermodesulfovibrionia bacterium]